MIGIQLLCTDAEVLLLRVLYKKINSAFQAMVLLIYIPKDKH